MGMNLIEGCCVKIYNGSVHCVSFQLFGLRELLCLCLLFDRLLISSKLFRHSWSNCKWVFGLRDFTTRFARATEDTEGDYSFPLPGDYCKGKTPIDRRQIGKRTKLAAFRAETFVEPSSPGPAKIQLLCALCVSVVNILLNLQQTISNYLWRPY